MDILNRKKYKFSSNNNLKIIITKKNVQPDDSDNIAHDVVSKFTDFASQITSNIYIGNRYDASNVEEIKKHEIKHILNLTSGTYSNGLTGINILNIPLIDSGDQKLFPIIDEAFEFIENAVSLNEIILVHCNQGISRAPTIVIAYLMKKNNIDLKTSHDYVKKRRPFINPNLGFELFLREYEQNIFSQRKIDNL